MLDSKSCRHSWKWEGWFCCRRWPFSHYYCTKSPASELLPRATKLISEKWQKSWNNCTSNKLQSINHTIGVYQHVRSLIYLNNLSHSLIHWGQFKYIFVFIRLHWVSDQGIANCDWDFTRSMWSLQNLIGRMRSSSGEDRTMSVLAESSPRADVFCK